MNETLKVLKERRSIRSYKPEQLREEDLQPILEAGTWAATAKNLQSPVMVVVQDPETIAHMSALNAEILGKPGTDPFFGAPTVVVVLADGELVNWLQDGSLVMGNLMTAAAATGIGSCWINRAMELFDRITDNTLLVRRLNIAAAHVVEKSAAELREEFEQLDLFANPSETKEREEESKALEKEGRIQEAILGIQGKFGKNALLKGYNLLDGATARDRNKQIGGHKA